MLPKRDSNDGAPAGAGEVVPSVARRRLLRGGLAAAPVIATVVSRPVYAGVRGACSPASSFASINASRPAGTTTTCGGKTPVYWQNPSCFSVWPSSCRPQATTGTSPQAATTFGSIFGAHPTYGSMTLLAVLQLNATSGANGLACHVAAALLNARSTGMVPTTVLSESTLKNLWTAYASTGYYVPTAGVQWYPDYGTPGNTSGLIQWIQSTMS